MTRRTRIRTGGFALLEVLFCVMAVTLIVAASGRLFAHLTRIYREAPASTDAIRSSRQWMDRLRTDVWNARDLRIEGGNALAADRPDRSIRWRTDGAWIVREEGELVSRWPIQDAVVFEVGDGFCSLRSGGVTIPLVHANRGAP